MGKLAFPDNPHALELDRLLEETDSDPEQGLSQAEASERLERMGPNKLKEHTEKSVWAIFLDQLTTPVIYLLAGAAALSFAFGDFPEGIAIVVVMLINIAIGFGMEYQARKSMQALEEMDKLTARVLREGEEEEIDAENLVPGDVVLLAAGLLVPADLRLLSVSELQINEAALTGESVPVEKITEAVGQDAQTADRKNMAYKGTSVTRGKGVGVVVATGPETEIGNVSELVRSAGKKEIPLNRRLGELSQKLIWLVLGLAAALAVVGYLAGKDSYQIIQTSIAWAIAAIPEGLPIVASIALARGMLRLADHNVIVKQLASVETLGETNTIFTDKTGTLTENRLTVDTLLLGIDKKARVKWQKDKASVADQDTGSGLFQKLLAVSVLANDAEYHPDDSDENEGDPLEIGLLRFARAVDADKTTELENLERVAEDPFSAESRMMGTVHKRDGRYFVAGKGATGAILEICSKKLDDENESDLSDEDRATIKNQSDAMSENGLRTLAFAYREDQDEPRGIDNNDFLENLVFAGLIGFVDPPAAGVKEAVQTCREAGIEVVMVTGDHPGTALNIARQVALVGEDEGRVIRGGDLREKSIDSRTIAATQVFSRVDPAQKLDLVRAFQDENKIVGMTGDGVNDTPALKAADIGIAMGKRGTQAAREVADMVLKDDSFPSIVHAIREGRIILGNIRKFIIYQLSYHFSEILVISAVMLILFELALLPLQLLFLNILLDVFPALALGIGRGRSAVMQEPPKDPDEDIVSRRNWMAIIVYGIIIAIPVCGVYLYARYRMGLPVELANNVAFFSLALAQLLNVLNMRDADENVFVNQVTRNKWVWAALAVCLAALIGAYSIPGLNDLLSLQKMGSDAWLLVAVGALTPAFTIQGLKQWMKS